MYPKQYCHNIILLKLHLKKKVYRYSVEAKTVILPKKEKGVSGANNILGFNYFTQLSLKQTIVLHRLISTNMTITKLSNLIKIHY